VEVELDLVAGRALSAAHGRVRSRRDPGAVRARCEVGAVDRDLPTTRPPLATDANDTRARAGQRRGRRGARQAGIGVAGAGADVHATLRVTLGGGPVLALRAGVRGE